MKQAVAKGGSRKSSISGGVKLPHSPSPSSVKIQQLSSSLRKDLTSPEGKGQGDGGDQSSGKGSSLDGGNGASNPDTRTTDEWVKIEETLKSRVETLEMDLRRRQESYVRRNREHEDEVTALKTQLGKAQQQRTSELDAIEQVATLRNMHKGVLDNINQVKDRTSKILQEQERDLIRAFRARLFDAQAELEKEKNRKDDGLSYWLEKNTALEKDLDWAKEMADKLERVNRSLTTDNERLKHQFQSQEDDREFLIKQLVAVKKDNTRLRQSVESKDASLKTTHDELEKLKKAKAAMGLGSMPAPTPDAGKEDNEDELPGPLGVDVEIKYKGIIKRLKKLVESERKNVKILQASLAKELNSRSELETFLRQCVEDVKFEIARRKAQLAQSGGTSHKPSSHIGTAIDKVSHEVHLSELSNADRERVMELLLSQERVIELLYAKTFPKQLVSSYGSEPSSPVASMKDITEEDMANIYEGRSGLSPTFS